MITLLKTESYEDLAKQVGRWIGFTLHVYYRFEAHYSCGQQFNAQKNIQVEDSGHCPNSPSEHMSLDITSTLGHQGRLPSMEDLI